MRRLAILILALSALGLSSQAAAQTVTDDRVWGIVTIQHKGAGGSPWGWNLDLVARTREGVEALETLAVRPILTFQVTPRSTVGGGYLWGSSLPASGGMTIEHRVFLQYSWGAPAAGGSFSFRGRFEERFIEDNSGPTTRVRGQAKFSHPIAGSRVALVGYEELFVHLNTTTRSPRGIEQNRAFVGIGAALSPSARLEAGYLHQYVPGHGGSNKQNHVLSVTLALTF